MAILVLEGDIHCSRQCEIYSRPAGVKRARDIRGCGCTSPVHSICVCVTSRIPTIPPHRETIDVPTLSTEAAREIFYRTYRRGERTDQINDILERLDYRPLSITLPAAVVQLSQWDTYRLTVEWEKQHDVHLLQSRPTRNAKAHVEKPGCLRPEHTFSPARWIKRLGFGLNWIGLESLGAM